MLPLLVTGLFAVAFALRILPHCFAPAGAGVDHWFWKMYIETYRRERVFPPTLPQYILDEHQWYPPVFPLLMAQLPHWVFDRWSHLIAIVIDLARMALLLTVAYRQSYGSLAVVGLAGMLYATSPILVSYNIQLNPRGLAALFLDGCFMLLLWRYSYGGSVWLWAVVLLLAGLILLTHKMTTQLLWFIAIGAGLIYRDAALLLLVPGSIAVAMVLSRGFYVKILAAHWDIVRFWNRHWRWIGADPLRESPIYGNPTYERPRKLHPSGLRGFVWRCQVLFGLNPAAWIACLLVYERLFVRSPFLIYPTWLLVWLLLTCLLAALTTFVSSLKCIGAGYLYLYNASLLASLVVALTYRYTRLPEVSTPFAALVLLLNAVALAVYYRSFATNRRTRIDDGFERMLLRLKALPRGVVMCLPQSWHEPVAYKTGQPVLYGAHGYGFRRMEPVFPRLLLPVREVVKRYRIRYLLTMEGVMTERFEAELPAATCVREGEYLLYSFEHGADGGEGTR